MENKSWVKSELGQNGGSSKQKVLPNQGSRPDSRDGDGRHGTDADAGRKIFFDSVRLKDGSGRRTDKISSEADGGGRSPSREPCSQPTIISFRPSRPIPTVH